VIACDYAAYDQKQAKLQADLSSKVCVIL